MSSTETVEEPPRPSPEPGSRNPPRTRSRPRRPASGASFQERCAILFEDLRKPARVMIGRAFGSRFSDEEIEDLYANAWASTLATLRGPRGDRMSDGELRSYLFTAVANHASKELRRRSRRPTNPLSDRHAQVLSDSHQPAPDERAVGSESGSVARDVLASLPPRRRAVMLLRYGWGLEPGEICALVDGLSPRAYRKEVTRGVGEMIERLGQVESGEWCVSREPILREYVAGTASEETTRQAVHHLGHCRACHELVGRLAGQLHELGGGLAWTALAGSIGEQKLSVGERVGGLLGRGRDAASGIGDTGAGGDLAGTVAAGGGVRGAGAAGAGALAKLAGLGAAGKAALACAGAAATACVAAGIVPPIGGGGNEPPDRPGKSRALEDVSLAPTPSVDTALSPAAAAAAAGAAPGGGGEGEGAGRAPAREERKAAAESVSPGSPAPDAPPVEQEFGLPGAAAAAPAGTTSGGGGGDPTSGGSGGGAASGDDVAREFGP